MCTHRNVLMLKLSACGLKWLYWVLLAHLRVGSLETGMCLCLYLLPAVKMDTCMKKKPSCNTSFTRKQKLPRKWRFAHFLQMYFALNVNVLLCLSDTHTHTFLNSGIWEAEKGSKEWRPAGVQVWGAKASWEVQTEREQHCLQANQPLYLRYEN